MRIHHILISAALLAIATAQSWASEHANRSKYVGQEQRAIKSLSPDDIAQLKRGDGWGLAKVAELNGLPGPAHVLELQDELDLSAEQTQQIQAVYDSMKTDAIFLGGQLIKLEAALDERFQSGLPTEDELAGILDGIETIRSALRFVHLSSHLKTPGILTEQQVAAYYKLRGYGAGNPCDDIPQGHDPVMWKQHNGCEQ